MRVHTQLYQRSRAVSLKLHSILEVAQRPAGSGAASAGPERPRLVPSVPAGPGWSRLVPAGPGWSRAVPSGPEGRRRAATGPTSLLLESVSNSPSQRLTSHHKHFSLMTNVLHVHVHVHLGATRRGLGAIPTQHLRTRADGVGRALRRHGDNLPRTRHAVLCMCIVHVRVRDARSCEERNCQRGRGAEGQTRTIKVAPSRCMPSRRTRRVCRFCAFRAGRGPRVSLRLPSPPARLSATGSFASSFCASTCAAGRLTLVHCVQPAAGERASTSSAPSKHCRLVSLFGPAFSARSARVEGHACPCAWVASV